MTSLTNFSPSIPQGTTAKLSSFINKFYARTDEIPQTVLLKNESLHDSYLDSLTSTATLKMGIKTYKGHAQIKMMRIAGWSLPKKRKHEVFNVAQVSELEFLVNGSVDYVLKNDRPVHIEWAGLYRFSDESLSLLDFYQVYLDTSELITEASKS